MEENNGLQINIKGDIATGEYSNLAIITHSHTEFVLDFASVMPGLPKAEVVSRVIMTPEHAKRLLYALEDNVKKYESVNGHIKLGDNPGIPFAGNNGPRS